MAEKVVEDKKLAVHLIFCAWALLIATIVVVAFVITSSIDLVSPSIVSFVWSYKEIEAGAPS
jgi:hypothetical protein